MLDLEIKDSFPQVYIEFLNELFDRLNSDSIRYCVLRNYETFPYPKKLSSDYDILLDVKSFGKVLKIINKLLIKYRLIKIFDIMRSSGDIRSIYFSCVNEAAFYIDLIKSYKWRVFEIFNADIVLRNSFFDKNKNIYIPKKGHEAVVSLFGSLFFSGHVKKEYMESIKHNIQIDEESFFDLLEYTYSNRISAELKALIEADDWQGVSRWAKKSKRRFLYNYKNNFNFIETIKYVVSRLMKNMGLFICIVGPDGSGKSTTIEELSKIMESVYGQDSCVIYHWRPFFLPMVNKRSADIENTSNPHAKKPYSFFLSFLRYCYFLTDFIVGMRVKVFSKMKTKTLFIFDRYYYDMYIDMLRFRLKLPKFFMKWLGVLVPKPDLLIYLDRDVDSILNDKSELSRSEIISQKKQFSELVGSFKERGFSSNPNGTAAENAKDIRRVIYEILSNRLAGRK